MITDMGQPFRHPRRGWLPRDPRVILAGLCMAILTGVVVGGDVYGGTAIGDQTHVVDRGDTVWTIADRVYPNADPRERVSAIIERNHLDASGSLAIGQALVLPAP